jgi:hypothetical protein
LRRLLSHLPRLALASALLAAAAGVLASPAAHAAGPYTVSLTVSTNSAAPGDEVSITASANKVVDSPHYIQIYDRTTGARICSNTNFQWCFGYNTYNNGTHEYIAYIGLSSTTEPPPDVQAVSNPQVVTWAPLGGGGPNPAWPSQSCKASSGYIQITEQNLLGGRVTVDADNTATDTGVCFRADVGTEHIGGRLNVHHTAPSVGGVSFGLPSLGGDPTACLRNTPPNSIVGTHPIYSTVTAGQSAALDAYLNLAAGVVVCATVNGTTLTVSVPLTVTGPTVDPGVGIPTLVFDPAS